MSPRFEINVPYGREAAFRQHVAGFDGAEVQFDESLNVKSYLRQRLSDPIAEDRNDSIKSCYSVFLGDIFSQLIPDGHRLIVIAQADDQFQDLRRDVQNELEKLDPRQADTIIVRYGLCSGSPVEKIDEVGKLFGVTKRRARQLLSNANATLCNYSEIPPSIAQLVTFVPTQASK